MSTNDDGPDPRLYTCQTELARVRRLEKSHTALLASCKEMLAMWQMMELTPGHPDSIIGRLEAAIAKAEDRS